LILKDRGCTVKELELRAKAEDCGCKAKDLKAKVDAKAINLGPKLLEM